jgi:hypothetical protein
MPPQQDTYEENNLHQCNQGNIDNSLHYLDDKLHDRYIHLDKCCIQRRT